MQMHFLTRKGTGEEVHPSYRTSNCPKSCFVPAQEITYRGRTQDWCLLLLWWQLYRLRNWQHYAGFKGQILQKCRICSLGVWHQLNHLQHETQEYLKIVFFWVRFSFYRFNFHVQPFIVGYLDLAHFNDGISIWCMENNGAEHFMRFFGGIKTDYKAELPWCYYLENAERFQTFTLRKY